MRRALSSTLMKRWGWLLLLLALGACRKEPARQAGPAPAKQGPTAPPRPPMPWDRGGPLAPGHTFVLGEHPGRQIIDGARKAGLLDLDLSDQWAPFIFSESDERESQTPHPGPLPGGPGRGDLPSQNVGGPQPGPVVDAGQAVVEEAKPNFYRRTFIALANNRTTPNEMFLESAEGRRAVLAAAKVPPGKKGQRSPEEKRALDAARRTLRGERGRTFLEVYGIPPTLSVLRARLEEDKKRTCYQTVDQGALAAFSGAVPYLNRERARRDYNEAQNDASWVEKVLPPEVGIVPTSTLPPGSAAGAPVAPHPATDPHATAEHALESSPVPLDAKTAARIERYRRGQARLRAVRAAQSRLVCEGLLSAKSKFTDGMFDLPTHEALALWEKKNDVFGWGFLGGETLEALQRPPLALHLDTFKRILMERVADAAGVIEDGSVSKGKRPATYKDAQGKPHVVPDLVGGLVNAVLAAMHVETPEDMVALFDGLGAEGLARLHVAIAPPPLPPYYGPEMELSAQIDRGDIWYDFPWDSKGKPIVQRREHFPNLTLFVTWNRQKIPLARWRTTIGSWRSELHSDGKVYYKYKNSDVGPRIWKNIVAAPVWIPPEGTPDRDMLTRKVFDYNTGPVSVVNTDIMGPGFESAYGLAMAVHLKVQPGGGLFDNQIRTHGSVDYTSIARRFSHGCHRLVNNRAVRLFDFVLRHRRFARLGNVPLVHFKKQFTVDEEQYEYELKTRGYYYELTPPVPIVVNEGRIMGQVKKPIKTLVRKPGVDYGPLPEDGEAEPGAGP
jgi:hypothetical protein